MCEAGFRLLDSEAVMDGVGCCILGENIEYTFVYAIFLILLLFFFLHFR